MISLRFEPSDRVDDGICLSPDAVVVMPEEVFWEGDGEDGMFGAGAREGIFQLLDRGFEVIEVSLTAEVLY